MADSNNIRVHSSVTGIVNVDETISGKVYNIQTEDTNIKSIGGLIQMTYMGAHAAKWEEVQIDVSSATDFSANAWNSGNTAPTHGALPTKIRSIGVMYHSKVGTPGKVVLSVKGTSDTVNLCALDVGEGIGIPLNNFDGDGFATSKVLIHQISNDGSNYGKISVALLGYDGS